MNHKIKVMPKERVADISDAEIHGLMDFDRLVIKAGHVAYGAKILANLKLISGGLAAVSVSALLLLNAQDSGVSTVEESVPMEQLTRPTPVEKVAAMDSGTPAKEVSVQKPSPANSTVQPKATAAVYAQDKEPAVAPTLQPTTSTAVYHEAEPVDGFPHLYEYFARELTYPEEGRNDSVQGVVEAAFVISSQGQVSKITLLNSLGPAFDAEAYRLISNMPAWKPATINGKPVASKFSIPLNFKVVQRKQD